MGHFFKTLFIPMVEALACACGLRSTIPSYDRLHEATAELFQGDKMEVSDTGNAGTTADQATVTEQGTAIGEDDGETESDAASTHNQRFTPSSSEADTDTDTTADVDASKEAHMLNSGTSGSTLDHDRTIPPTHATATMQPHVEDDDQDETEAKTVTQDDTAAKLDRYKLISLRWLFFLHDMIAGAPVCADGRIIIDMDTDDEGTTIAVGGSEGRARAASDDNDKDGAVAAEHKGEGRDTQGRREGAAVSSAGRARRLVLTSLLLFLWLRWVGSDRLLMYCCYDIIAFASS